jgi:hypothetical protein
LLPSQDVVEQVYTDLVNRLLLQEADGLHLPAVIETESLDHLPLWKATDLPPMETTIPTKPDSLLEMQLQAKKKKPKRLFGLSASAASAIALARGEARAEPDENGIYPEPRLFLWDTDADGLPLFLCNNGTQSESSTPDTGQNKKKDKEIVGPESTELMLVDSD